MITAQHVTSALFGAWRLAHFDADGMRHFDQSLDGFWKSFYAALIVLPAEIILLVLAREGQPAAMQAAPMVRVVTIEVIAYVMSWVAFPLVMIGVADLLDRRERYFGFIVAANWATVVQVAVILPAAIIYFTGGGVGVVLYVLALLAIFVYAWFVTKVAMDVPGVTAFGVVLLSLVLDLMITGAGDFLIAAG